MNRVFFLVALQPEHNDAQTTPKKNLNQNSSQSVVTDGPKDPQKKLFGSVLGTMEGGGYCAMTPLINQNPNLEQIIKQKKQQGDSSRRRENYQAAKKSVQ